MWREFLMEHERVRASLGSAGTEPRDRNDHDLRCEPYYRRDVLAEHAITRVRTRARGRWVLFHVSAYGCRISAGGKASVCPRR